jgi:hypothetical protein
MHAISQAGAILIRANAHRQARNPTLDHLSVLKIRSALDFADRQAYVFRFGPLEKPKQFNNLEIK